MESAGVTYECMYTAPRDILRDNPDLRMNDKNVKDLVYILCLEALKLLQDLILLEEVIESHVSVHGVGLIIRSINV